MQQIIDIIKNENDIFEILVDSLFEKFFKGRNVNFKVNDFKFLIKHTVNFVGAFDYLEKLLKFTLQKDKGGARTLHQINQSISLIQYTIELTINKSTEDQFKNQHIKQENISTFLTNIENTLNNSPTELEQKDEKLSKKEKEEKMQKMKGYFVGIIGLVDKLILLVIKTEYIAIFSENFKRILKTLETITDSLELNNMKKKISEINEKITK